MLKVLLFWVMVVGLVGCVSTTEQDARNHLHQIIVDGSDLSAPGVREAILEISARPELNIHPETGLINVTYLIYKGVSDEVILAALDAGASPAHQGYDYVQSLDLHPAHKSPYYKGNAFQTAISVSNSELAEKIAIRTAKEAGDYREGLPLGAIPSVVALATGMASDLQFGNGTNEQADRLNASISMQTYYESPGLSLLFRHSRSMIPGGNRAFFKKHNINADDAKNANTYTEGGYGSQANLYEIYVRERFSKTVNFILSNFGGDVNEALPFCQQFGDFEFECIPMSPTQLAGYTNSHRVGGWNQVLGWQNPGKLEAYLKAGGDPNVKDPFGNTPIVYAQNGGYHPSGVAGGNDLDIGKIFAGAAVLAGSGYLASQGGTTQAIELLGAGMADVVSGDGPNNLNALNSSLQTQQSNSNTSSSNTRSTQQVAAKPQPTTTQYSFSCSHTPGKTKTIPISTALPACRSAMETYARVSSCNLVDEMEAAQNNYYSACASEIYE